MSAMIGGKRKELFDYIRCVRFFEFANYLNVKHQVPSVDIFHHIIQAVLQKQHVEGPTQILILDT